MSGSVPARWLDRLTESLREHEDRQNSIQGYPPRYEVLGEISRGGMGIIYRAWDPQLGRNVALKVLRAGEGNTAEAHERFQREAKLAAALHHPNIIQIFDSGTWNGQDYIAMQLIEGTTLDQARPDRRQALVCIRDAARALHFAHGQGIVHRDVKPGNLLVDGTGRVYVTDFGVARQAVVSATITSPGTVVGTPAYMSPEQAQGLPTDARSDVYSLGATLYELVTGRPPVQGRDALEVLDAVRTRDPLPPCKAAPDLSKNVEAILLGALERAPEERYASAAEFADEIDRYLVGERPLRRGRGATYRIRREFVRHPWRSTGAVVLAILLVLAGIFVGYWIRGYRAHLQASRLPDGPDRRKQLEIAARWFGQAAVELEDMNRRVEEQKKEAALAAQRAKDAEIQARLEKEADESKRLALIEGTEASARKYLDQGKLDDARQAIEALRGAAPARYADLLPRLRALEFDAGLERLKAAAAKGSIADFTAAHRTLGDPAYEGVLDRHARIAGPTLVLARRLKELKNPTEALRWFDEAEMLGLREARLFEQRGLVLLELRQWERAQKDLDLLMVHSPAGAPHPPEFAQLSYRRGREALLEKDWTRAIQQFEITFYFDRNHAAAHHDRGLARYYANGLAKEALTEELRRALQLDPKLAPDPVYRDIALAFSKSQTEKFWASEAGPQRTAAWREAVHWLGVLLERGGPDGRLLLERSRLRRRLREHDAALRDAAQAGESVESLLLGAQITFVKALAGARDEALLNAARELAARAIALDPAQPRSMYWEAVCLHKLGKKTEALDGLKRAAALGLDLPDLRHRIAMLAMEQKDPTGALEAANAALARLPALTEDEHVAGLSEHQGVSVASASSTLKRDVLFVRATAYLDRKQFPECIADCAQILQLTPDFAKALIWSGYAKYQEKRYREARDDFDQAARVASDPELKKHAAEWRDACRKLFKE